MTGRFWKKVLVEISGKSKPCKDRNPDVYREGRGADNELTRRQLENVVPARDSPSCADVCRAQVLVSFKNYVTSGPDNESIGRFPDSLNLEQAINFPEKIGCVDPLSGGKLGRCAEASRERSLAGDVGGYINCDTNKPAGDNRSAPALVTPGSVCERDSVSSAWLV